MYYKELDVKSQVETNEIEAQKELGIILSVNDAVVRTKSEGENKTSFRVEGFNVADSEIQSKLKQLFCQNVHSINAWRNPKKYEADQGYTGHCLKTNYMGVYGVALDYDDGSLSLAEAREKFKDYINIIYTSSSHRLNKPDKNGVQDRFRVILPFKPMADNEPYYKSISEGEGLYATLKCMYPDADSTVFECGRKLFPFGGKDKNLYECHFNIDGEYIFITPDEIREGVGKARQENIRLRTKNHLDLMMERKRQEHVLKLLERDETKSKRTKVNRTTGSAYFSPTGFEYIMPDQEIILSPSNTKVTFQDLKEEMLAKGVEKVVCYCSYCDDLNSDSASAWISPDLHGSFVMTCSHCKSEFEKGNGNQFRFYEYPVSGAMFSVNKKCYEIRARGTSIAPVEIDSADYRDNDEWEFSHLYLRKNSFFVPDNFTINYVSNPELDEVRPQYNLQFDKNAIEVQYPMVKVDVDDNKFILDYHKQTFGEYADFVLDWEALYTYTNYETLPVMVLVGERGMGKNTFVQMIANIYPNLWASWDGDKQAFNSYYTKKLLWIDENSFNDKHSQYNEIKFLTGNEYVRVNEKYQPAYQVRNNAKVIITTNDMRPLAVKDTERPTGEKDNNFFFYKLPNIGPDQRDRDLKQKLSERLGHFCRTELKERYDRIIAHQDKACRYFIPCPITDLGRDIYNAGKTDLDMVVDEITDAIVNGVSSFGQTVGGGEHIKYSEVGQIVKRMELTQHKYTIKHYITALQKAGVIGTEDVRLAGERLGYKVLIAKTARVDDDDIF